MASSARFRLKKNASSPYLSEVPDEFELPIAHAEGRFVTATEAESATYVQDGRAALLYSSDVNGSTHRIAGLQDKTGRVFGHLQALLAIMKGLPLAYNRDLQEDKIPLFDTVDTVKASLQMMREIVQGVKVNAARMLAAAQ